MRNVGETHAKKIEKIFSSALLGGLFCLMLTGCDASRESVCKELPAFHEEAKALHASLQPRALLQTKQGRKLASVTGVQGSEEPSEAEIREWLRFGEKSLKKIQWASNAFESDTKSKKIFGLMNEGSLSLVSFHGYIGQKKWRKAFNELEKLEANLNKVNEIACLRAVEGGAKR